MKPQFLLGLALVLAFILTGCETETIENNHLSVTSLNGDGGTDTCTNMFVAGGRILPDGRMLREFPAGGIMLSAFPSNHLSCWVVLLYPTNQLNQISEWQIDSWQVCAWLLRTSPDDRLLRSIKSASELPFPKSEPLRGKIEAGEFDWRHKNRHYLAIDLTGDNGFAIKGEFDSWDKTKFDAKQLWLDPVLLFYAPFMKE
jgi:hypothetical protein